MSEDTWYFAYGSNMSVARKEGRTDTIRKAERGLLDGYRLAFNKRASDGGVCANIIPDANSEVWGVMYLCDQAAMRKLDKKEGVTEGHYERSTVFVENPLGELIQCQVYIAAPDYICEEETPNSEYFQHLLDGARDHDLPKWYVEFIRELGRQKSS